MKLAVLFPGIGYTCDKPLLYYSGKLAAKHGYELMPVPYGNFSKGVKGNRKKMEESFETALLQSEKMLRYVEWKSYGDIVFISKSIGTIVASCYAKTHSLPVRSILFTPLADTFRFAEGNSIAFHGTADPWAETPEIVSLCREKGIPLYLTEGANHSLETGDIARDIGNLGGVMERVEEMLKMSQ